MTSPQTSPEPPPTKARHRIDGGQIDRWVATVAAIVLSTATVLTAWSGYQASRWGGVQSSSNNQASKARMEAAHRNSQATLRMIMHLGLFEQYVVAIAADNRKLADFLYARFPQPLRAATDDWLKTNPLTNADAPRSPFDMASYRLREQAEADRLENVAEEMSQAAGSASAFGERYVLLTLIFAMSLFFCGISTKVKWPAVEVAMLAMGVVVLVGGVITLLLLPVR